MTNKSIEEMVEEFTENYYSEGEDGGIVFSTGFNGQLIEEWVKQALTQAHQAGIDEAVERIWQEISFKSPQLSANWPKGATYNTGVVDGWNICKNFIKETLDDTIKALQDKK